MQREIHSRLQTVGLGILVLAATACGRNPAQESGIKVFGGTGVQSNTWRSTVAIIDASWGGMWCTGTAINSKLVITAAHCLAGKTAQNISVYVGDGVEGGQVGGQYPAAKILIHPSYSRRTPGNDIAFIDLQTPLELDEKDYVKVLLDEQEVQEVLAVGTAAHIVGYGNRDDGGSGLKFEVDTKVVTKLALPHDPKTEIAIGGGGLDSCNGDSGGPVFGRLANGEWRVYGITSRGGACGTGGIYGLIHTNICWVQKNSTVALNLPEGYCKS